jgi:hypothetical protein
MASDRVHTVKSQIVTPIRLKSDKTAVGSTTASGNITATPSCRTFVTENVTL